MKNKPTVETPSAAADKTARKYEIKNRYTGKVIFSTEAASFKLAVKAGIKSGSDLSSSDLRGSNLSYSDLRGSNLSYSNLSGSNLRGSNLRGSDLRGSDLRGSNLSGSNLSGSNLRGSNLRGSNLSGSNLSGTKFPAFPKKSPSSYRKAVNLIKKWFSEGHWIQSKWIDTPDGAYSGTCRACLHGAAWYLGGKFGEQISNNLVAAGFTTQWNDIPGRKVEEVIEALNMI